MRLDIDTPPIIRPNHIWSDKQKTIFQAIQNGSDNMIIEACAGGAKTSTIVESLYYLPQGKSAIFVAFNKSIADSLKSKVPCMIDVYTLHGVANTVLKQLGWSHVNARKTYNILKYQLLDEKNKEHTNWFWENQRDILSFISILKGSLNEYTDTQVLKLAREAGLESSYYMDSILPVLYRKSCEFEAGTKGKCTIDFEDMLRLPLLRNLKFPTYDYVFVDEVQDLNSVQREIVCRLAGSGRVVAVGDRRQAIYAFRGADTNSMDILQDRFKCVSYPLKVSYRCAKEVVKEAQSITPSIEALSTAKLGSVSRIHELHLSPVAGDMILCRVNAPLVATALKLVKQGHKVALLGKDFATHIYAHVAKIPQLTTGCVAVYFNDLIDEETTKGREAYLEDVKSTILALMARGCNTLAGIKIALEAIFVTNVEKMDDCIILASIHKAKGLEAENVYLLRPDLIPHPMSEDETQEYNLKYVAITRAKTNFYYVD